MRSYAVRSNVPDDVMFPLTVARWRLTLFLIFLVAVSLIFFNISVHTTSRVFFRETFWVNSGLGMFDNTFILFVVNISVGNKRSGWLTLYRCRTTLKWHRPHEFQVEIMKNILNLHVKADSHRPKTKNRKKKLQNIKGNFRFCFHWVWLGFKDASSLRIPWTSPQKAEEETVLTFCWTSGWHVNAI